MWQSTRERQAARAAVDDAPVVSSLKEASPAARRRQQAVARSAQLTNMFDRLSSADAKLRETTQLDDVFSDGGATDLLSPVAARPRQPPPLSTSAAAPPPPLTGVVAPSPGGVILRSGRAVVLSANSRRLPHVFRDQARAVRSVEETTTGMLQTLQHLHRDLVFHAKGRADGGHGSATAATHQPNTPAATAAAAAARLSTADDSEPPTPLAGETTAALQRRIAEADARAEAVRVQRARAAAADEGASDDQSVEDYGVDGVVPPLTSESRLADEVAAIAVALGKMRESAAVMCSTEAAAPSTSAAPWWSSALRMRDMKASAARLDYHAHAALNWSHRAREQLLLQAAMLNNISTDTRTQLLQQQHHWQEFQERLRDGQLAVTQLQADIAQHQARVQAEMVRRAALQEELRVSAQERGLVDVEEQNPLKAELALLLEEREWPSRTLKRDADVVVEWLRSVSTALE
ncbi:hypothetical protein NESM_000759200 [Novymonas esmeraldas]|uniref:Uncharacterized protein n=1 Tax=Novymonas esmeraldas TaxID=1808958 RepID=A0AAW0EWY6_9TRYP